MTDLAYSSWLDTARLMRQRELSPVEYTECLLSRIDRLDTNLNAFLHLCPERALESARQAEQDISRGKPLGPLHGVPYALKDIIDVAGLPTTAHSKILENNIATSHATVAASLQAAGGVLLGKLATHEFALGGPCFDLPWPPARNPWDTSRMPGGSSSGSGVAVAAGLVPLALGSDTAGSVRNPASACSIVGMKPTYGRVSRTGVIPLAYSLDTLGPLTRTVAENAAALNLISAFDPRDAASSTEAVPDFSADLQRGIRQLRIGFIRHFHTRDSDADTEVTMLLDQAASKLGELGADVVEVETRPLQEFASCNRVLLTSEAYSIHEQWLKDRPQDYGTLTRDRLLVGAFFRSADYLRANRIRRQLTENMNALLTTVDVIICASSFDPPCAIDDAEAIQRTYARQARAPFNATGHPALSIPCGFSNSGLPIGMQIVGAAFDEVTVYRVASAYEQAVDWKARHPPLD